MPKNIIDYSNTVIYKIYCKDQDIQDIYVGHTTNFIKRKYQHKLLSSKNYHNVQSKIYETIQQNGGWDNWNMVELATYNCKDLTEARIREQEYYELLKPTLNTVNPISKDIQTITTIDPSNNNNTQNQYLCNECNYLCFKKFNFKKHLLTVKHIEATKCESKVGVGSESSQDDNLLTKYNCTKCNKKYTSRNGLWKHKKIYHKNEQTNDDISNKELVMIVFKENLEFKNMMMTVVEKLTKITHKDTIEY
jgi:hypothetical protein